MVLPSLDPSGAVMSGHDKPWTARPRTRVEVEDARHLGLDRGHVGVEGLGVDEVALLGPATRIAHNTGGASGQCDGSVPRVLEAPQHQQADEVADVQAVGARIAAVVEADGTGGESLRHLIAVGRVVDQAAGLEIVEQRAHATGRYRSRPGTLEW